MMSGVARVLAELGCATFHSPSRAEAVTKPSGPAGWWPGLTSQLRHGLPKFEKEFNRGKPVATGSRKRADIHLVSVA
jgi:hypothetical protein